MTASNPNKSSLLDKLNSMEQAREVPNEGNFPRMYSRFVVRGDALLHPMNRSRLDTAPLDVKLRDVSRGGIGFICEQSLTLDTNWRIEFQLAGYAIGHQALVVRHISEVGEGMYLCGANFVIDSALIALLGVDPALLSQEDKTQFEDEGDTFLAPDDVA